jgi:hypothetical protein
MGLVLFVFYQIVAILKNVSEKEDEIQFRFHVKVGVIIEWSSLKLYFLSTSNVYLEYQIPSKFAE